MATKVHPDEEEHGSEEGEHPEQVVGDDVALQLAHQGHGVCHADLVGRLLRTEDDVEAETEARHACTNGEDREDGVETGDDWLLVHAELGHVVRYGNQIVRIQCRERKADDQSRLQIE